ncbi:MAG: MotA/TolQ/ExbB proton channel family protein [Planctomycetaceae bacterium]|nr:MotA/TolQ/ExbB proton channel family protein [Planctomycetaceae bacterium]
MNLGTTFGLIFGTGLIFFAALLGSSEGLVLFFNLPALLIVFGGSLAALMIAFPLKTLFKSAVFIRKCFLNETTDPKGLLRQMTALAETARREGLLALESRAEMIDDKFLAEGIRLAVDGLNPETVETILNSETESLQYRHQQGRNIIVHGGKYTPAFGMIGTLIGLVLMLTQLDAETVGPGMAVAVLTTLYGTLAANLFLLPIAEKMKQMHEAEMLTKKMIIRGVLSIQAGEHPRILEMKLQTFLPPEERSDEQIPAETVVFPVPADVSFPSAA